MTWFCYSIDKINNIYIWQYHIMSNYTSYYNIIIRCKVKQTIVELCIVIAIIAIKRTSNIY